MNWPVNKKVNIINSSQNEGLSPSGNSSKLRLIWLNFIAPFFGFHPTALSDFTFFPDFQLFRPEHHWRDLSSRNAHLEHQNCSRICFTKISYRSVGRSFSGLNRRTSPWLFVCLFVYSCTRNLSAIWNIKVILVGQHSSKRGRGSKSQNRPHLRNELYFSQYVLWMCIS
jgi:hypothetical protein